MTRHWPWVAIGVIATIAALAWPLTAALPTREILTVRLSSAIVAALACTGFWRWQGIGRRTALGIAALTTVLGVALMLKHFDALTTCIVDFEGRPVIIGTSFTDDVRTYLQANPGLSASDRLFDAGGVPDRVWTSDTIRSCRLLVSWAGLMAIPLFAISACALIRSGRFTLASRSQRASAPSKADARPIYDGFISYRHVEPDRTAAFDLVDRLEATGLRIAIDARDFSPNQHFLSEMERCVRQSRFVLCVVSTAYVQSDHTTEEAIISKTVDLAERTKRLVPLIYERVELPLWLHGLVGIDFTSEARVDPYDRLVDLLNRDRSQSSLTT